MLSVISVRRSAPLALLLAVLVAGCWSPPAQFRRNEAYALKNNSAETPPATGLKEDQWKGVDETLIALYGTPDIRKCPRWRRSA